ncbi:DUF1801 domain-containing protein [Dokdonella sp.]|uniref:DUF1801 domain-containing protein n=1 Tax=Dokdonella sp. TaxID=2291710 RepID=UPI001B078BB9|nr:DUF1801 domain-containing protein [Dokdonella sp.]MBO9662036.1 DUF1801 domain-containing protein [Dokdonella sp.]
MARSTAATVDGYLAELPPERRAVAAALRALIVGHLPDGYVETINWGMPSYEVPLSRYPDTYNGQPLGYVAFAAQKNGYSLYLSGVSMDPDKEAALRAAFAQAGKKLDMGKACVRFRKLDDLPLPAIGALIAGIPVADFIASYERSRQR